MNKQFLFTSALAVLGLTACEKGLVEDVEDVGSGQVKNSLLQMRTRGVGGSDEEATVSYPLQVYVFQGDECKAAQTIGDEGQTLNIALVEAHIRCMPWVARRPRTMCCRRPRMLWQHRRLRYGMAMN